MGVIGELVDHSSNEVRRIRVENGTEMPGVDAPDAGFSYAMGEPERGLT
jgi:hypothetical protein